MSRIDTTTSPRSCSKWQRGVTLVELMVALVIGLVILIAVSAVFVSSSASRREVELSADVIESGRYALDVLGRDLSQTGFYGTAVAPAGATNNAGNMCSIDVVQWADTLPYYAVGLNSAGGLNVDADPACLTAKGGRKPGTDALFVQRSRTCTSTECGPEDPTKVYVQVSECGVEYSSLAKPFVVAGGGSAALSLQTKACDGTKAPRRELIRRIYYISSTDVLSYVDMTPNGASAPVAVVENIEQMQISYGIDNDDDGTVDIYSASPPGTVAPADLNKWAKVVGVRIWLLARSSASSANTKGATDFILGDDTTFSIPAASRNLKRRVYSTYISFVTPTLRRAS